MSEEKSVLTSAEWKVYDALSDAFNKFIELPKLHESDYSEFAHGVNVLINIVMSRAAARELRAQGFGGYLALDDARPENHLRDPE